jgi:hypothetical protein
VLITAAALLTEASPAQAQTRFGFGSPLEQVMNDNMSLTCMGPGTFWLDRIGCIRFSGGQYWRLTDGRGIHLNRPVKIILGAGAGAAIGRLVSGNTKGTLIGAAIGGVATYIATRPRGRDKDEPMVVREGQQVRIGSDGVPVAVGQPVAAYGGAQGAYQPIGNTAPSGPRWYIRNLTGGKGELFDGGQFIKVLEPGETYGVTNPQAGFQLMILVPTEEGTLESVPAQRKPRRDGWDMVAPSVQ